MARLNLDPKTYPTAEKKKLAPIGWIQKAFHSYKTESLCKKKGRNRKRK
jgi:hypothetical protein